MSSVGLPLLVLAVLAGMTGTWSPCGLSTIETLRVGGVHDGGRATALYMALIFTAGAVAGALISFLTLALLGSLLQVPGMTTGDVCAVVIAAAAAILEASGVRIVPQIRRQVPELWRRRLPAPLAAVLYGGLLGLGFTTFVMSFAVWALAGIAVALGTLRIGLTIGLGFGVGRALPVLILVPVAHLRPGRRVLAWMTQRTRLLRGMRGLDALALAGCALALSGPAKAATPYTGRSEPSAVIEELAWQEPGVGGFVYLDGRVQRLPGEDPALGGQLIAWREGQQITVANRLTLAPVATFVAEGADLLAVSAHWLVYRVPPKPGSLSGRYELFAVSLSSPNMRFKVTTARAPDQLGRPALFENTLVFADDGRRSRLLAVNLSDGRRRVLRSTPLQQLLAPSIDRGQLLYVRTGECRQELVLGSLNRGGDRDRVLLSRPTGVPRDDGYEPGVVRIGRTPHHCIAPLAGTYHGVDSYWSTALSPPNAFLTVLHRGAGAQRAYLLRINLARASRPWRRRSSARRYISR